MDCEKYLELMSGALDGEAAVWERRKLDRHLARCPECAALFAALSTQISALRELDCEMPEGLYEDIMGGLPQQGAASPSPTRRRWGRWAVLTACMAVTILAGTSIPVLLDGRNTVQLSPSSGAALTADSLPVVSLPPEGDTPGSTWESQQGAAFHSPMADALDSPIAATSQDATATAISEKLEAEFYPFQNTRYLQVTYGSTPAPGAKILGSRDSLASFLAQFSQNGLSAVADAYGGEFFQTRRLLAVVVEEGSGSAWHTLDPQGLLREQVILLREESEAAAADMGAWLILTEVWDPFEDGDVLSVILK